jgi:hypothetical protein
VPLNLKIDKLLGVPREGDLPRLQATGQVPVAQSETPGDILFQTLAGTVSSSYLAVWFESIASGTTDTLSPPANGTLSADHWPDGVDALVTTLDASGQPTWEVALTAAGSVVTATLNVETGVWELSAAPASYPVGLIFAYTVPVANLDTDYCLIETQLLGDEPDTEAGALADANRFAVWQTGGLRYVLYSTIKTALNALYDLAGTAAAAITAHEDGHPAPDTRDSRNDATGTAAAAVTAHEDGHPAPDTRDSRNQVALASGTSLPGSPTTGQWFRLTAADTTAKAPPGLYYYSGSGWHCRSFTAVYDLGNLGATPSHTYIPGVRYKATQDQAITSWTVAMADPGEVSLTISGAYSFQSPTMSSRTAKALGSAAWDDSATAIKLVTVYNDGTYLHYICSEDS